MRGIGYTIFSNFFTALTLFFTLLLKRSIPGIRSSVHHVSLASIHALVDSNIHLGFVRKTHDPIAPSSSPISLSSNPFGGFGPHDLIDFSGILSDRLEPTSPSDSTNPPSTSPSFSFSGGLTNAFCISGPLAGDDWSANFTAATTAVGTQFSDLFTRMHSMAEILRRVVQAEITAMHGERNETYVGYEPLVARMLAAFAQLSYCDLSRLNRLVANPMDGVDFSHLSFVRSWEWSEAGMGAYVALEQLHDQVHHRLVLAFRGSENFQNWFTNLNVFFTTLEACDGCRVHAGFQNMWDQIRKDVIGALNDILDEENIREFLITGHSLGGAIAVLASLDLVHMWDRKAKPRSGFRVYTFGQPRVGNMPFARHCKEELSGRAFRVTREGDPIVRLPGQSLGYHHAPHEVYYDSTGQRYESNDLQRDEEEEEGLGLSNPYFNPLKYDPIGSHVNYFGLQISQCVT